MSFRFFVDVRVDEHAALPEGCSMRFRAVGEPREVQSVRYESEDGAAGVWRVESETAEGARVAANAVVVEDSGAGTVVLIYGGEHGLRLTSPAGDRTIAEPYLALAPTALVDDGEYHPSVRRPAR